MKKLEVMKRRMKKAIMKGNEKNEKENKYCRHAQAGRRNA